jgi:hypothetical protein
MADLENVGGFLDPGGDLLLGGAAHAQAEGHVVVDALVRVERVILEHHGDVAVARRQVVHHPVADGDLAAADRLEPGDHAQQRGLAAARGADQHHEFTVTDVEVDAVNHGHLAENLLNAPDCDARHPFLPSVGRSFWRLSPDCAETGRSRPHPSMVSYLKSCIFYKTC